MQIFGINQILNWLSINNGGRFYTCPMKTENGVRFFHFKRKWHKVNDYLADHTTELVREGGKIFSRKVKK